MSFLRAQRMGLVIDGPKAFTRAFPKWFDLYPFAHIGPAGRKTNNGPARALYRDGHIVTLRIVRLGEPRDPQEGTRIGTVRRPPRGVRKERYAPDDWFDVWFPDPRAEHGADGAGPGGGDGN